MKEQNFLKGWIAQPYDENAGYDCMYPGVKIELEDGQPIVTVDEGDFMFEEGMKDSKGLVLKIAALITNAPELLEALKFMQMLYECDLKEVEPERVQWIRDVIKQAEG